MLGLVSRKLQGEGEIETDSYGWRPSEKSPYLWHLSDEAVAYINDSEIYTMKIEEDHSSEEAYLQTFSHDQTLNTQNL